MATWVAAGPGSFGFDELLAVVGGDNVLAAAGVRYPKISVEEVLRAKPEVILDLSYAAHGGIEVWSSAKGDARVVIVTEQALLAPSPRVVMRSRCSRKRSRAESRTLRTPCSTT